jgi:DNA-binding SARP family transcriptional activator/predicted ATPase
MPPELQVRCLGRLSLHCREASEPAARELPLPATLKSQSLLAYLVVHRDRPQSRDHLAELFWGDRPEHNARRSLATALWQIRRCLPAPHQGRSSVTVSAPCWPESGKSLPDEVPGNDYILADAACVQFNRGSAFWLDVAEFEKLIRAPAPPVSALQQAVALVRGDFLDGFYDDWVLSERYRLESLYCDALAGLMAALEALGEHAAALAAALRLLEQDPLREDAHRAAMRAYCRLGQRHAALAQYGRCREALRAELGVAPLAETLALRQAIVEGRLEGAPASPAAPVPLAPPRREPARHPLDVAGRTPLVGREQELAFLAEAWRAALAGQCSLMLVSGEAGVGKTRLVQEFAEQQQWQGVRVLQGRCYEFERLLPYQPVTEALRSLPPAVAAAAAAAVPGWVIAQVARLAPDLFGQDLALPGPGTAQVGTQERLFEAASLYLARLAAQQPLLLVLEDLHWAADSTLQLLHYLARTAIDRPLLIVGTLRSEAVPPATPLATLGRRLERDGHARRLELPRLSAAAVASLIGQMSGEGEAAAPLAERLYRETEGNPFYLSETIKALFEAGAIRVEAGVWRADYAALGRGRMPLPAGVSETIAARVGRLSEATQDAVRVAAVAGREFDFDLLNGAWAKGEEATLAALDDLLRNRLIGEAIGGAIGGADYAFTHHKIREVVYGGLPRHRRLHLHGQVGMTMERWLGAEAGTRAVELAFHFEQARQLDARLTDKAIAYLLQAGRQAERQSANPEALAYYRRGLDILHSLPETPERLQQEIELQMALAVPTTVVHGYASPETRQVYDRAGELCRKLGDTPALFTALVGLSRYYGVSGDLGRGLELAEQMLAIAEAAGDADWLLEAWRAMGGPLFALGRLREARAFFERGAARYDPAEHERHAYRFGHDPAAIFHGYLSLTLWLLGYPVQAAAQEQRLRDLMRPWSHPTSLAYAHCMLAKGACARRDVQAARRHAEEATGLGQTYRLPSWTAMATALRGWALAEEGHAAEGLAQLHEGITAWRARGFEHFASFFLALQAESCLKAGKLSDGVAAIAATEALADRGGDRYWMAELSRLQGELAWAQGEKDGIAEAHFRQALETARGQEARMLELRASMSLARLWQSRGRNQAAREILAGVYARFDEGFETPDLQSAAALLSEM